MKKTIVTLLALLGTSVVWGQATTTDSETTTSRTYSETMMKEKKPGGFFLEPAIFGTSEDTDLKASIAGADNTGTSRGFGVDLKLGGHLNEMFFIGADGRYERSTIDDASYASADTNVYNWGPVAGFQAPFFGLRVWGTYIVDGSADPDSGNRGVDLKFKDPYGWRVGAGVRFAAVSVNLEYEDLTYRTTEVQSFGDVSVGQDTNIDYAQRGYGLSLSFPIQL